MPATSPSSSAMLDAVVVGGGLGGLATATLLARGGRRVTLFERTRDLGGRAMTTTHGGFHLNLGPHALYRGGAAARVLADLGVTYRGGAPSVSGAFALDGGVLHTLPGGFVSLLTTKLLPLPAKVETARLLGALPRLDAEPLASTTVRAWLERAVRQPAVRALLGALLRLSTYADDPERASAGAALAQLKLALSTGVLYLDGGWQTLVDGLRAAATTAGVRIVSGARVLAVEHDQSVRGVRLGDGTTQAATTVVVAAGPDDVATLIAHPPVAAWVTDAVAVRAATLDVALERLPRPRATFALGIDRPLYCSVHSAVARLGPAGTAVIHVAKYLGPEAAADERELEGVLDLLQPGWRPLVRERRMLPRMVVSNALVTARAGGTAGRPGPAVPGVHGLYVVGDWVGPEGMLADATLASAERAAALALRPVTAAAA